MSGTAPPVERTASVAAGAIGPGRTTVFLARGLDVAASDPAPGAKDAAA